MSAQAENASLTFKDLCIAATRNAARIVGWGDALGTLEQDKYADLLVINGAAADPYEQLVRATERDYEPLDYDDREMELFGFFTTDRQTYNRQYGLTDEGLRSPSHRVATSDRVGNYLEAKFGTQARAFMDDRYDMFPVSVIKDYRSLEEGGPDPLGVLDKRHVDVVLWKRHEALPAALRASSAWKSVYQDDHWEVFRRS